MRPPRRARDDAPASSFCDRRAVLFASAATANAECAWVLWQQQAEIAPGGSVSSSDWTWLTAAATSTEAECRQVSARFDAKLGPKDADGYSTVNSKDKRVRVRNVCLPLFVLSASCRPPQVFVMQSTNARHLHHPAFARQLHTPKFGRVFR